ncbi:excinuclease ABC subunit UvrC [Wolbachia endosymbiont of Brugia malayi]|uniref:UvrABC system protein C n=1 Tax=Wolbachia sp. subsp. Brugia malayi (strain TRS) TaxID=292805 RepID=UVRC_WOLTR|nr:excinuclease ABC subunit UvrC [Wolbachia endosymbiont of Brugia malayi]Q5GSR4.1 RecName: Full=UvrABC system protein C; Short=Protein UvrC; AltName: Full=Excinuclease ABC subunit C [Wolbachia endosymbiont strain TRS of Brugia malayi]AAW70960.1 Nuclease subunit of the excinuclease complex, UvrC [Wolbachia endosymbiont strain TRS of Brugia malayi]QCB61912.1 excinuclease ABC subunit UvrC [Wolbachia endosymbiont of Brugia malayi]
MGYVINIQAIKKQIELSPQSCGVYQMIGDKDKVLYVGKAKNLKSRLSNYLRYENLSERTKFMLSQVIKVEVLVTENEIDALLLEARLIKSLKPPYNIIFKDGRSYPYIVISKHNYPRIAQYRGKFKKGEFHYYGPFISVAAVKQTMLSLQKTFLLRVCSDQYFASTKRPCIEYQIKRCSAPCVGKITKDDYCQSVKQTRDTLLGRNEKVKKQLSSTMEKCSKEENYELAAIYRDRLKFLEQIQMQSMDFSFEKDADFFGIARKEDLACIGVLSFRNKDNYGSTPYFVENCSDHPDDEILSTFLIKLYNSANIPPAQIYVSDFVTGKEIIEQALHNVTHKPIKALHAKSKKEHNLLKFVYDNSQRSLEQKLTDYKNNLEKFEELSKIFLLPNIPKRVEVYDNSHTSGNQQVGVMVVAGKEGFLKSEYRKFTIKGEILGDDYEMMREVLTRRFSNNTKDVVPDFLLIDGGPGHISVVQNVLNTLNINVPFACMAKGSYRNAGNERFYMPNREDFTLKNDSKVMLYLQSLRNEAHRFAITSHRKKRDKQFFVSPLSKITSIGDKRKNALMSHFGSVENISKASLAEIQNVARISKELAEVILKHVDNKE